jgi:mannose-6-phosphate isomerase-like protein (cupin superfamily)
MKTPPIRIFVLALPVAFFALVVGSTSFVAFRAFADRRPPPIQHVVKAADATTHVIAGGKGLATLLMNPATGMKEAALTRLVLEPGAEVPTHTHEESVEILYVERGRARMVVESETFEIGPGDGVYIPAAVPHSAEVVGDEPLIAVQVYVGPGPEARFRQGPVARP